VEEEVKKLIEQTTWTRYQFLLAEIQTCVTALDMGLYELSAGNAAVAKREAALAEKGTQVIRQFLREVPAEQRPELEMRLTAVEEKLALLKADLDRPSPPAPLRVR
jgi:hypothetical protein